MAQQIEHADSENNSIIVDSFLTYLRVEDLNMKNFMKDERVVKIMSLLPVYGDVVFSEIVNLYADWSKKSVEDVLRKITKYLV